MLREPRRLLSVGIAIALGVAFMTATLLFGASLNAAIRDLAGAQLRDAAVVVSPGSDANAGPLDEAAIEEIRSAPGVEGVTARYTQYAMFTGRGAQSPLPVSNLPVLTDRTRLVDGRLPQSDEEVAISTHMRDDYTIALGEQIPTQSFVGDGQPRLSTVVGFIDPGNDAVNTPRTDYVFATDSGAVAITGMPGYSSLLVQGQDPDALKATISGLGTVQDHGLTVRTRAEELRHQIDELTGESSAITNFLLVFAGIALFVSVIVIANTFSILVAQRSRQLAMMRCVGATKGQVFSIVLGEALVLGLIGSAVGIALGAGLVWLFLALSKGALTMTVPFTLSLNAFVSPYIVGVLVTLLSSLSAARRATAVAPLAALHPELANSEAKRLGAVRAVLGSLLVLAGAGLLVGAWRMAGANSSDDSSQSIVLIAMAGGGLGFLGVIGLGRGLIPALSRVIGQPLRRAGVPGELAVANSRRNPGRAASTANALLVGVTLITVLVVGASCTQATIDRALGQQYPQDASIQTSDGINSNVLDEIRRVPEVAGVETVTTVDAQIGDGEATQNVQLVGVSPEAAQVSRIPERYEGIPEGHARTNSSDFTNGQRVTVNRDGRSIELTVDVDSSYPQYLAVTPATLAQLDPEAPEAAWVRYTDQADAQKVTSQISQLEDLRGASITSGATQRAQYQQSIDIVLLVAMGLLAMAVIIAVIGVGNTLSLSVLERIQELGLLRALGMTRGQVRQMVAWESVTLAAVATLVGLVIGSLVGLVGARSLLASSSVSFIIALPWGRLAALLVVALIAGWLASLAPAARAVRVAPSAALATE